MNELEIKLLEKAQRVLFNPQEVTEDVVILSLAEANDLIDNKPIPQTLLLDLALLRIKENLKIELTEYEQKNILSILNRASKISVSESNEVNNYSAGYGKRESIWDI